MNFSSILTVPEIPAGLGAAKAPSVIDNLSSGIFAAWQTSAVYFGLVPSSPATVAAATMPVPLAPSGTASFDYDGEGKADLSRWQSSNGEWRIKSSLNGTVSNQTLGWSSDKIAPADYDSDGKTDIASFTETNGTWTIKQSSTGTNIWRTLGQYGDIPVSANYGGDSRADIAVFRPSNSTWYYIVTGDPTNTIVSQQWGASGDVAVPGNYDGDSKADFAVFRPSSGYWFVLQSSNGVMTSLQWGISSDTPVPADYDGDGKTDCAVYRSSNGTWYAYKSSTNNGTYIAQTWGNWGDQPVPADYNNDGRADLAVWRPKTGVWHIAETNGSSYSYTYQQFGATGDLPTPAAYLKKIGASVAMPWIHKERLSPKNATGGTDLYSQNFSWGSGLVGLPGRAGLDAGFGISYNSLIWMKVPTGTETAMVFDPDSSNVTPGFRFGFPTIEQNYSDYRTGRFTYIMTTPSGARVDFRQIAASDTYETGDSSYTQLKVLNSGGPNTPVEDLQITVISADGTQMKYVWLAGLFRCSEIKDRNGNKITVSHDATGLLKTVTDTLGRVITVNYDAELYPTSITQTWKNNNGAGSDATHTWATFSYGTATITTAFDANLSLYGPQSGTVLKVLNRITRADDSYTTFDYNAYGQVWRVNNYAKDNHKLNHIATDLETISGTQTDCPRFKDTKTWAENFNQNQEVVVTSLKESVPMSGLSEPVTRITVTAPDGITSAGVVVEKTYIMQSTWREGLPFQTETCTSVACTGTDKKRWTSTVLTQDDNSLVYRLNPRVAESTVSDAANSKKTEIVYETVVGQPTVANYGRVKEQKIYNNLTNQLLKRSSVGYKDDAAYISRRILGLPSKTEVYGLNEQGAMTLAAKTTYEYDEGNLSDGALEQNISPNTGHDTANYGTSFVSGRGNLTKTTRCDASLSSSTTCAGGIESTAKYNTVGAIVSQTTPGSTAGTTRTVKISYADKFNDNNNSRGTYAYPTKITDPAGYSSDVKYRFDTGANVWAKSPAPAGHSSGKETVREYDSVGRLEKEKTVNNGAYTRYQYFQNAIQAKVFATVVDLNNNNVGDAGDEVLVSETFADGAGRVRKSRSPMSWDVSGAVTTYSAQYIEYDVLGRVKRQSAPVESNDIISANGNWKIPITSPDYRNVDGSGNSLLLWTSQTYDWKGRVKETVNTDGTNTLANYEGCGCAGGEVVTVQSELVPRDDDPTLTARRTEKIFADVLGRQYKTQTMKWDGTTPYTTIVNTFNERDQITKARQYDGGETATTFQDATTQYDGYGRTWKTHRPEQQNSNGTPAFTVFAYNADDSAQSITDARGAATTYGYNNRGLVESISYSVPQSSGIPLTPAVGFGYDAVGNRTWMTDGLGRVDYEYNSLSQLTAEVRQFSDSLPNAPLSSNRFRLETDYTVSGQLKLLKDPFGQQFNYAYDKIGRLNSVAGSTAFDQITTYASGAQYNARGALTGLNYGNGAAMTVSDFNDKLQATKFEVKKGTTSFVKKEYQFYADGSLKYSKDLNSDMFDRLYKYDQMGRTVEAKSGANARGETANAESIPYKQSFSYNAFGNIAQTTMEHYASGSHGTAYTFTNNRNTDPNSVYDADGNQTADAEASFQYDAAGRMIRSADRDPNNAGQFLPPTVKYFDGTGEEVKRIKAYVENGNNTNGTSYFIRSSVTGKIVSEASGTGEKWKTFVSANGATLASQLWGWNGYNRAEYTTFWHQDASGASLRHTNKIGESSSIEEAAEYDALGNNVGLGNPYVTIIEPPVDNRGNIGLGDSPYTVSGGGGGGTPFGRSYYMDGMPVSESYFMTWINSGLIGGAFGLLEMSARMSIPRLQSYDWSVNSDGKTYNYGRDAEMAFTMRQELHGSLTLTRNWVINNSWAQVGALVQYFNVVTEKSPLINAPNEKWRYVDFKNNNSAKGFLKSLLGSGNCGGKITALLDKLGELYKNTNSVRTNNLLTLFDIINSQSSGGIRLNSSDTAAADEYESLYGFSDRFPTGGGQSWMTGKNEIINSRNGATIPGGYTAYIHINREGYSSLRGNQTNTVISKYAVTLIHELLHVSGSTNTYSHYDIAMAVAALVPGVTPVQGEGKAASVANNRIIDTYIGNHCEPKPGGKK